MSNSSFLKTLPTVMYFFSYCPSVLYFVVLPDGEDPVTAPFESTYMPCLKCISKTSELCI